MATVRRWSLVVWMILMGSAPAWARDPARWAVEARGGTWSVPDALLDAFLDEHPSLEGESFGLVLRSFGASGDRGVFSVAYALDYGRMSGTGVWLPDREEPEDRREGASDLDLLALSVNWTWDIMPEWRLHPYLGLGVGIGYADGRVPGEEGDDDATYRGLAPVIQIPVGLKFAPADAVSLFAEARWFTGGLFLGGGVAYQW